MNLEQALKSQRDKDCKVDPWTFSDAWATASSGRIPFIELSPTVGLDLQHLPHCQWTTADNLADTVCETMDGSPPSNMVHKEFDEAGDEDVLGVPGGSSMT